MMKGAFEGLLNLMTPKTGQKRSLSVGSSPVNCEGAWTDYTSCSKTCGGGVQTREYKVNTANENGGIACLEKDGTLEIRSCNVQHCPVDCNGNWSDFSKCSKKCGGGSQSRKYNVNSEAEYGGLACAFKDGAIENRSCNSKPCSTDCAGAWSDYSSCSKTCGGGIQTREFQTTATSAPGGKLCPIANGVKESRSCNSEPCAVDCKGSWSEFGACSKTCGGGEKSRIYSVDQPAAYGGKVCPVRHGAKEIIPCNSKACPVDCKGAWTEFDSCSKECGGGSQSRKYVVSEPSQFGGLACPVKDGTIEQRQCNSQKCPINCDGEWSEFTSCSKTCGGGTQARQYVVKTANANGGVACPVKDGKIETRACASEPCPVDCEGTWSDFNTCSKTCGGGIQTKTFTIKTPAKFGGKQCAQQDGTMLSIACNKQPCPVDCEGSWVEQNACSKTCGDGVQSFKYTVKTDAANNGKTCSAKDGAVENRACNTQQCPPPKVDCEGS